MSPRNSMGDKPANHTCENCNKHRASLWWVGDGGPLATSRFYMQAAWCKCCSLKTQIRYTKKLAKKLNKLETELTKVNCREIATWEH